MLIGASYYSECWPTEQYATDARLMAEAGFNVVRLGECAWIDRCLGTPTRVAPPWLVARDRSMLIVGVARPTAELIRSTGDSRPLVTNPHLEHDGAPGRRGSSAARAGPGWQRYRAKSRVGEKK